MVAMSCSPGTTGIGWRRGSGRGYALSRCPCGPFSPAWCGRCQRWTRRGCPGSQGVEFRAPKARSSSTSWRARCAPARMMNSMSCFRRTGSPRPVFSRRRRGPPKCGGRDGLGRVRSCSRCCSVTSTGSCRMTCWSSWIGHRWRPAWKPGRHFSTIVSSSSPAPWRSAMAGRCI